MTTIIIIIILAGITINLSIGENGIFTKSKQAREAYQKQAAKETINLKITAVQMETYAQEKRLPTLRDLAENFCQDNEFEDVEERTSTADKDITKISNNPELLMVKLKAYPYEFEIDGELRLASIDGEKIASSEATGEFVLKSEYNELKTSHQQLQANYNALAEKLKDYDNIVMRLEDLENGVGVTSKQWKHLKTVTGSTSISLSSIEFDELLVITGNVENNSIYYSISIPYADLDSSFKKYRTGHYHNENSNLLSQIEVSKTEIKLTIYGNSTFNYLSNTQVKVYYK